MERKLAKHRTSEIRMDQDESTSGEVEEDSLRLKGVVGVKTTEKN